MQNALILINKETKYEDYYIKRSIEPFARSHGKHSYAVESV